METLGRSVRGELGGLTTVAGVLAAAAGKEGDPADPTVAALRRAAALRAEALESAAALRAEALESAAVLRERAREEESAVCR